MKFALYFGNRGFFPESLIGTARDEMAAALERFQTYGQQPKR